MTENKETEQPMEDKAMQGTPKLTGLIFVAALVVAVGLSFKLTKLRVEKGIETQARSEMVYLPFLGLEKFAADIHWMTTLNDMGGQKKQLDENGARFFLKQFNKITNYDPDFLKIYEVGAPHIAYVLPDESIKLMEKGQTYAWKEHWKRPYYAAHWIVQVKARKAATLEEKKEHWAKAISYLEEAGKDDSRPWYVDSMLLRLMVKKSGKDGNKMSELEAWYDYYNEQLKKYAAQYETPEDPAAAAAAGAPADAAAPKPGEQPQPPAEEMMVDASMGMDAFGENENMRRLREKILNRCRSFMKELIEQEADAKTKKAALANQKKVRKIYADLADTQHYCARSLDAYAAGDLFDSATGVPVTPYGVDLYELEVNQRVMPVKGDFNTMTGRRVARTFDELKELLKAEKKAITFLAKHTPEATKID